MNVTSSVSYTPPSAYELNVKQYGPVVANAIGAAEALGAGASSLVNISAHGLKQLEAAAASAGAAVADVASQVQHVVGSASDAVEHAAEAAVQAIGDAGEAAATSIVEAGEAVADTLSDAAEAAGHYLALGAAAVVQSLDELA